MERVFNEIRLLDMMIEIPLSYNRIFPKDLHGSPEELLKDIPSRIVILVLCYINHQIYLGKSSLEIFDFISRNWSETLKNSFLKFINYIELSQNSEVVIFSEWFVTENIKYELLNFRDFKYQHPDTTPRDEFNIFIAHLKFMDLLLDEQKVKEGVKNSNQGDWFNQMTWPLILKQFEFMYRPNLFLETIRGNLLLSEVGKTLGHETYLNNYLKKYSFSSSWSLVSSFLK